MLRRMYSEAVMRSLGTGRTRSLAGGGEAWDSTAHKHSPGHQPGVISGGFLKRANTHGGLPIASQTVRTPVTLPHGLNPV